LYRPGTAANRLQIKRETRRKQLTGCVKDNESSQVCDLQDIDTCTFEEEDGKFVQLLICVANIDSKSNEVKAYDSMCTGDIPMSTKEVIASLVRLSQIYIFLKFQQQVAMAVLIVAF
jgi:hypothetical protein